VLHQLLIGISIFLSRYRAVVEQSSDDDQFRKIVFLHAQLLNVGYMLVYATFNDDLQKL
jgi:hypothetical protein